MFLTSQLNQFILSIDFCDTFLYFVWRHWTLLYVSLWLFGCRFANSRLPVFIIRPGIYFAVKLRMTATKLFHFFDFQFSACGMLRQNVFIKLEMILKSFVEQLMHKYFVKGSYIDPIGSDWRSNWSPTLVSWAIHGRIIVNLNIFRIFRLSCIWPVYGLLPCDDFMHCSNWQRPLPILLD